MSKTKTPEQIVREIVQPKPRKARRPKSAADAWYAEMLADYKVNGAEHLSTAKAKLKG